MGWSFKNGLLRLADKCDDTARRLEGSGKKLEACSAAYEAEYRERKGVEVLLKGTEAVPAESSPQALDERLARQREETRSTHMKAFGTWLLAWWMWH